MPHISLPFSCGQDTPHPAGAGAGKRNEMADTPHLTDDDKGEITVTLDGKELRGWSYADDDERRTKMHMAHEYVDGWHNATRATESRAIAAEEKLNLANTGGLSLLYDIRRELGWNDKTSLSILASGVRRVRRALQTWDTPTGMELEALALAVKARVSELERAIAESNARIQELLEAQDESV